MADISKITLPSGTTYDIKDAVARSTLAGAIKIKGTTTTALTDEATTNPITIGGQSYTAIANDAVFYQKKDYVFDGTKWHEFGDMSGLGSLATKNSVSASYTPVGTVSQPSFTGNSLASSGNFTPAGSVSTVYNSTSNGASGNFTPAGEISTPTITVTPNTASKYVAGSSTGGGSVTNGTAASFTATVSNETLTLGWEANTPTAVTLPSFSSQTIVTGIQSATSSQPTFSGTKVYAHHTFSGTQGNVSVTGTPSGTVSQPTFSGTPATITSS